MFESIDLSTCLGDRDAGLKAGEAKVVEVTHHFLQLVFRKSKRCKRADGFLTVGIRARDVFDDRQMKG